MKREIVMQDGWKFMMSLNDISKPLETTCVFYYAEM